MVLRVCSVRLQSECAGVWGWVQWGVGQGAVGCGAVGYLGSPSASGGSSSSSSLPLYSYSVSSTSTGGDESKLIAHYNRTLCLLDRHP